MDTYLDICLIILMIGIIILVGIEIVLLIIRAIIACKEDKEEIVEKTVEEKKKETYLVSLTYNESVPNGRFMKKFIYVKAVSPEEALKQAEEYFLNNYLSPALRASYKKGEYVAITKSIENCVSIN